MPSTNSRPQFVEAISSAYSKCKKSLVFLTGNVFDLFWSISSQSFLPLEQTLYQELSRYFTVLRLDAAQGISFYEEQDETALLEVCELADSTASKSQRLGNLKEALHSVQQQPLPALVLLRSISEAFIRVRRGAPQTKPLCTLIQFAGSMFPAGEFEQLSELDRLRLVTFLNWISDPLFGQSSNLIILLSYTKAEVNKKILALPSTEHVEIQLPDQEARKYYVQFFTKEQPLKLEQGLDDFVIDASGLKLTDLRDIMEENRQSGQSLTRKSVLEKVNSTIQAELGDIVRVVIPEHTPEDIVGSPATKEIFNKIFKRCDDPSTAVSGVLVSGPNGGGKTFQLEAFAGASGRIVIELTGLRGMYFGQTDSFFERLRWHLRIFGRILILVDEAHTAFGSVHKSDTHETEKRLAGNIIKMMGDRTMLGKVVWGLMTSRPDELDPDVKSRSPIQVPIFDPEGEDRKVFVRELFSRSGIKLDEAELEHVLSLTLQYSARDFSFLMREVKADQRPVTEVLHIWQASSSIQFQRRMQELIASQHCSYPALLPERLRKLDPGAIQREIEQLKLMLG